MFEEIFWQILRIYLKIYIFIINKIALLRKKWKLRKEMKTVEAMGGKVKIKNNKYIGGTTVEIEFLIPDDESKGERKNT